MPDTAPDRVLAVALDVTQPEQGTAAVRQAQERFGDVDVLVNNAGYGYRGAVEEGDDADARANEIAAWEELSAGTNFDA